MTDDDTISRIEAALEARPTPAEWEVIDDSKHIYSRKLVDDGEDSWRPLIAATCDDETLIDFEANARFIAACNPVAIRALLDRLKAAEAENERLRGALEFVKRGILSGHVKSQPIIIDDPNATSLKMHGLLDVVRAALENTDAR